MLPWLENIYVCNTQETDKKVEWTFQDWCAILPL